jgi:YHS domain-containing protein
MGVIRLVVLTVLAYAAWLLIRGIMGWVRTEDRLDADGKADVNSSPQDVLVEDPVCHTLVPKHQSIRLRKDGTTYYFCSDECCDKFSESARGKE